MCFSKEDRLISHYATLLDNYFRYTKPIYLIQKLIGN